MVYDQKNFGSHQSNFIIEVNYLLFYFKVTFIEYAHQVIIMKPKSMWQRGRSSVTFSFKKSKYNFKVSNCYTCNAVALICFNSAYCWSILQMFSSTYLVAMFLHLRMVILSMIILNGYLLLK